MSEPTSTPAPAGNTTTACKTPCWWRIVVFLSFALNALLLLLILLAIIVHHCHREKRHKHQGCQGGCERGHNKQSCSKQGGFGGRHFHRFGGGFGPGGGFQPHQKWGQSGNFGGHGPGNFDRAEGKPGMMGGRPGMMGNNPERGGPPDPAKMADNMLNHLTKALTLTDDQKAKIKPIIAQQVAQIQKDREAQRAEIQKSADAVKAQIKALLTPDQQKQFDALPMPGQKPKDGAPDNDSAATPAAK